MATDTVTIAEFVKANGISLKAQWTDKNPLMDMSADMDHWKVTLNRPKTTVIVNGAVDCTGRKLRMTLTFSKGYGHNGAEPTVTEVLSCLASDAAGIENSRTFCDWCAEYGYDIDSRKAEKIWKASKHQTERLRAFLGDSLFDQLVWHTEQE